MLGAVAQTTASQLEHFRAKWIPVRVKKMRPNKDLERFRDSVKFGNALALHRKQVRELVRWSLVVT